MLSVQPWHVGPRLVGSTKFFVLKGLPVLVPRSKRCRWGKRVLRRSAESEEDILNQDCPVPIDQQPVQELKQLQDILMFNWATLPVSGFAIRLAIVFSAFFCTIGLPVSAVTFNPETEPVQCIVAASAGSLVIVLVTVIRLYLGWSHVGDRLLSATVIYEETGWYDGQVWVKTPQMLTRDRLEGNYTVKPALTRLKNTLLAVSGAAAMSVLFLTSIQRPVTIDISSTYDTSGNFGRQAKNMDEYWSTATKNEPEDPDDAEAFVAHMRGY